ncbi:MAG: O-antigen ligase family protein [Bacteroidetes bacterium]|nr:O-antigen ligase family protein [Bacteroidota bacterium]
MTKQSKIALVYLAAFFFIAVNMYLVVTRDLYYFFGLPIILLVLYYFLFSLDKILLLIAFVTPLSINFEDFEAGLGISLPSEPLLFGVMILFFAHILYYKDFDKKVAYHPISITIYVMFAWMFITTLTSELPVVSLKYIVSRLWFVVPSFFVAAIVFRKFSNVHRFIWLYNIALIFVIAYTIINHARYGFSDNSAHWVMSPLYNDHTAYGAALAMFLILTIGYVFYPGLSNTRRFWVISMAVLLAVATLLSLSRAAWISLAAALLIYTAIRLRIKLRWILFAFALFLGVLITFQHEIIDTLEKNKQDSSTDFVEHVQSIYNITSDASNLERINRWQAAFRLYDERPVFGWGPGTYQFVYGPFQRAKEKTIISTNAGDMGNAHSEYIGPLAEMGLPGMLIMFLIIAVMIYTGLKTHKRAKTREVRLITITATLALISYFVHGLLNNFLDTDKLSVPVWACMAIIVVMDLFYADMEQIDPKAIVETTPESTENISEG